MNSNLVEVKFAGATLQLPPETIVQNWLESVGGRQRHPTIPAVGKYWSGQGGVNAGLVRGVNGNPDYFLIVPDPADTLLGGQKCHFQDVQWGSGKVDGAESDWDGSANTRAILQAGDDHPAAKMAAGVRVDGHQDFYLPARRELSVAYTNVPELFQNAWYWSSTQYSADYAWNQFFCVGTQYLDVKSAELRAFAVRRVFINSVI